MATIYGYARCSTNEMRQDIDRQKRELYSLGVQEDAHIYWEYESGTKTERPELSKLFDTVSPGDTITTTEVSRLTRSTKHLCEIMQFVQDKGIKLVIGSFVIDCSKSEIDPMTKGMLLMWGVFAEMERDIISQRVKSGMQNAKKKGKKIGRPVTTKDNLPASFWKYYSQYKSGQINVTEMSRLMKCSRTSIYKYINICKETENNNGYIFFWGLKNKYSFLSNFYYAPFVVDGLQFRWSEQYFMYQKALLFLGEDIQEKILEATSPQECKKLGRTKSPIFDDEVWNEKRQDAMYRAVLEKFRQNPRLKNALLETGDAVLVESSPKDKIWGIGLSEKTARQISPQEWPGQNLLGQILMKVRQDLSDSI